MTKGKGDLLEVLICSLGFFLTSLSGIARAADLSTIDRAVGKQPTYASREPKSGRAAARPGFKAPSARRQGS
jgi:hypothetical protein